MRHNLRLYPALLLQQVKVLMEYRANFVIAALSTALMQAAWLLAIWVVVDQVPVLGGWTRDEIGLIYSLLVLIMAINRMFLFNLFFFGQSYIRTGRFDRLLVRPVSPLLHMITDRFSAEGVGDFLVGVALLVRSFAVLGLTWDAKSTAYLAAAVLCGTAIVFAINLLTATLAFWMVVATPVTLGVNHLTQFARYPLSIFGGPVKALLTWVLPYGLCTYYPAMYLLGRETGFMAFAALPVAAVALAAALAFWEVGLKRYSSTGS